MSSKIQTLNDLHTYLRVAMQLEHATIPPYLLALYSIHPGKNLDATQIIRVVVVEEMLHLTLAANVLNAVGGDPNLTVGGFIPTFPTPLPDGENDFLVDLQPFSRDAVQTFLNIERPKKAPSEEMKMCKRHNNRVTMLPVGDDGLHYYSIGEFYEAISDGLKFLSESMGDALFPKGREDRQVGPEYYYSGGGQLTKVNDLESALSAVGLIIEQGEGFDGPRFNPDHELAHDYRFSQLDKGKYYQPGDEFGSPSGLDLKIDWDAVYQFKKNAKMSGYEKSPELYAAANEFNKSYAEFLALLTRAYNGDPGLLLSQAVPDMFTLRNKMLQLIHNPIPGQEGLNAAPTFEAADVAMAVGA